MIVEGTTFGVDRIDPASKTSIVGIVYVTDVINAGDQAEGVPIPADVNVVAEYPIAVTRDASNAALARAFVDFVISGEGQSILESYGFTSP